MLIPRRSSIHLVGQLDDIYLGQFALTHFAQFQKKKIFVAE